MFFVIIRLLLFFEFSTCTPCATPCAEVNRFSGMFEYIGEHTIHHQELPRFK
uniref:Thioredoxin-related n=1 Tax=Medicago truncatula TaxID=3880 RepID=Q2HS63_MEDTR|nr:Thioredoxin-related [Medicago truncatula]ABN08934.1 Thioredoxin-related [Medicago truncatula]